MSRGPSASGACCRRRELARPIRCSWRAASRAVIKLRISRARVPFTPPSSYSPFVWRPH